MKHTGKYPRQIWLLFWGTLVSMTGQSLVWPFLTITIREQLGLPLAQITLLFTLQSIASMVATAGFGPAVDRFGRKWAMITGPVLGSIALVLMSGAHTLLLWAVLLCIYAGAGVIFRIGSNAMVADMIEPEERAEAYALLRMASNVGIAVGPAAGGFLIGVSYALSFNIAAAVQALLAIFVVFMLAETLPVETEPEITSTEIRPRKQRGYGPMLKDRPFMSLWSVYMLIELAASLVFVLLAVYIKEQFSIPESQFGFILGTNAAMLVLFQYAITRITRRHNPLAVMALSGLFYAGGMAAFALGFNFLTFWLGIVIMTIGELMLAPTATAVVANLAPADMRARYMGVYGMSYRIGSGIGPAIGGALSDAFFPAAPWFFGMVTSLLAAGGFMMMARSQNRRVARAISRT